MEEEELELLNEIDLLHEKLLCLGNGYTYAQCAKSLRDKVVKLYDKFEPDYIDGVVIQQLNHTCNKEVDFVKLQQDKASKPRASQKSKNELIDKMGKTTKQIEIDVYSLFKKIDELKEAKLLPLQ